MTAPTVRRKFDWEAAGRELGETLGAYHAIVVVGVDPVTTGRVAIGIARAQAMHRRTAVGDLFAESPPIQELVHTDDPHGLVDSFLYGVSLSRIAYEVPGAGQLFVMPSGSEPPSYEEILPNPRWERLAAGFREVKALMVLACPATAPRVEKLIAATDGVIVVGDVDLPESEDLQLLGSIREPRPKGPPPLIGVPTNPVQAAEPMSRRKIGGLVGGLLGLVLASVIAWLAYRPLADAKRPWAGQPDCSDKAKATAACDTIGRANVLALSADSARRDSVRADSVANAAPVITPPTIANPADSVGASPFAVELLNSSTQAGAILKLQKDGKSLPAATFSPALFQGQRWFTVVTGAFSKAAEAESLLVTLRRRGLLQQGGNVVNLPFAFLLDSVKSTAVAGMTASYLERGQPVYALRQPNGSVWLLVGAFASAEQAALYVETLHSSGIQPVLVYRKGRSF